jgi:hypothetical protein
MYRRTGVIFDAKSAKGQTFRIIEEVDVIDVGDFDNPNETADGLKKYTTTTGLHANRISDSEYEILNAGPLAEEVRVKRL